MGKMLHNEARELLVESYEKTHNAEEIAKIFGVNKYTVYHCLKPSPARFCASINGIASAGLRSMDIACNFRNCYNDRIIDHIYPLPIYRVIYFSERIEKDANFFLRTSSLNFPIQ